SGFISDIGFDTYHKILEEAIQELKESDFKDIFKEQLEKEKKFVQDVHMDVDVEMMIPDEYVSNIEERLRLYTELDRIENEEGIENFSAALVDRFGPIPSVVEELFDGLRMRWSAKSLGVDRVTLLNGGIRCYFDKDALSVYYESQVFRQLMDIIGTQGVVLNVQLKQSANRLILIREKVKTLRQGRDFLDMLLNRVSES